MDKAKAVFELEKEIGISQHAVLVDLNYLRQQGLVRTVDEAPAKPAPVPAKIATIPVQTVAP